jgi:hypothetical protein
MDRSNHCNFVRFDLLALARGGHASHYLVKSLVERGGKSSEDTLLSGYAFILGTFTLQEIGVRILGLYPVGRPLKLMVFIFGPAVAVGG